MSLLWRCVGFLALAGFGSMVLQIYRIQMPAVPVAPGVRVQLIGWRVQRDVNAAQLEYCKELLRPVHTEFMPPTYPMPKHHNCTPGHEPSYAVQTALWNVPGASELIGPAQILKRRITTASTAPGDHWHIVHRGCSGPKRRYCLRCQGSEYDEHCRNETVNVDVAVQAVVAREKPLSFARKMKLEKAKVPERSGKSKDYGMLVLECDRWKNSLQGAFLGAPPPVTPVSRCVVAVAPENSAKPEGAPAVAVLIIGAARAMVWPEVCENIQENLVKGLASLGPDGQHWRVDVFFFLALEESIQARDKTMIRHSFEEELLKPCQDLMKPVHAYDYVTQEFEPKVGLQYQAFLRARPDGVYLHPVPPMGSFALSQLTISATAPGDHWHLIHRGCLGPFERRCLRCRGKEYDKRCPKPKKEVIARERSADVVSELLGEPLTGRGGAEGFGFLWLECDRWEKLLSPGEGTERGWRGTLLHDIASIFHSSDLDLCWIQRRGFELKIDPASCLETGRVAAFYTALQIFRWRGVLPRRLDLLDFLMQDVGSVPVFTDIRLASLPRGTLIRFPHECPARWPWLPWLRRNARMARRVLLLSLWVAQASHWWETEVMYQIYPRSFQDSNGDAPCGTSATTSATSTTLMPFSARSRSNLDFKDLVAAADKMGIKVLMDFVPNHSSNESKWFLESKSSKTNPKRNWYVWHPGVEVNGTRQPPNNWASNFGGGAGSAWTWDSSTEDEG
eukprot:g31783.t1